MHESSHTRGPSANGARSRGAMRRGVPAFVLLSLGVLAPVLAGPAAQAAPPLQTAPRVQGAQAAPSAQTAAGHGKPGAPALYEVYGTARSIAIAFDAPASDGGHKIRYYQATVNGGKTWKKIGDKPDADGILTGYRRNLTIGKHYEVAVRAVNSRGHSARSRVQEIVAAEPPSTPRRVTAKADESGVIVSWKAPKTDGGRRILLRRRRGRLRQPLRVLRPGPRQGRQLHDHRADPGRHLRHPGPGLQLRRAAGRRESAGRQHG
jgi:hypothetical protein